MSGANGSKKTGAAITLQLKIRNAPRGTVTLNAAAVTEVQKMVKDQVNGPAALMRYFTPIGSLRSQISDVEWLEIIANFVPEGGIPVKEQAQWSNLALRVDRLDPEKEGTFTINAATAALIKKRLEDERFKFPSQNNICWIGFYVDLCHALGYQPVSDEGLWDDDVEEESGTEEVRDAAVAVVTPSEE